MTQLERAWLKLRGNLTRLGAWLELWLEREITGGPVVVSKTAKAKEWGMMFKTVTSVLSDLEEAGVITKVGDGPKGQTIYEVTPPLRQPAEAVVVTSTPPAVKVKGKFEYTEEFLTAWAIHPRGSKQKAFAYWKAQLESRSAEELTKAIQSLADFYERQETEQQYQKHLSTFLSPNEEYVEQQGESVAADDAEEEERMKAHKAQQRALFETAGVEVPPEFRGE